MEEVLPIKHIFVDHSNIWGGARLATKIENPELPDICARISIKRFDTLIGGRSRGIVSKIVSGGIPPGMEGVWIEYQSVGYDTQRLFRDEHWKERGVDHTIIGHMWKLLAKHRDQAVVLVLASGDGKENEFGTSFHEVLNEILKGDKYPQWKVELFSFDWPTPNPNRVNSPTSAKMKQLVERSSQGKFVNLMDSYSTIVFHQRKNC